MNKINWERWGAATGYLVLALGVAGAAFERGAPPANAPIEETLAFFAEYRGELLAQSLMFVLSAGVYLWFFGSLRSFLLRAEGGTGTLSTVAFGAGVIWAGIQMVFQSAQVALAMGASGDIGPALAGMVSDLIYALSVIAYVPMTMMLAAVAVVSLRTRVFPAWLGWLSAVIAAADLFMSLGIVVDSGPLVPGGGLTYVLYVLMVVWLVAVTTVMVVRLGKPASTMAIPDTPVDLQGQIGPSAG
ncbi:MAG: hypothetical protein M5U01_24260 [Ardenticatenaceae bacterium]|nr:hypothetical protein [Ardenticatenaceae bacterium]